MLIACLWSHWVDPKGGEPDLLSFAAITYEPEPEVAAAGHDRTIINLKPQHVDAWLNPAPGNLTALYAIFDDKQHPYYEHWPPSEPAASKLKLHPISSCRAYR